MSPTPVKSRHTNRGYRSVSGGHSHKVAARAPGADSVPHWGDGEWSGSSQSDDGLYHPGQSHKSDDGQYHSNQDRTTDQDQLTQQQQQAQQQQAAAQQQQSQNQQGQSGSGQSGAYGQSQQGSQAGSSGQSSGSQGQSGSGQSGAYGASQQGSQAGSSGQYAGSQGQSGSGQSGSGQSSSGQSSSGQSGSGQSGSSGQSQGSQAGSSGQYSGSQGQSSSGQSGSYDASQQGSQAGTNGQSAGSQGQSSSGQTGTSGQSSQQGSQAGSNSQAEQAQQAQQAAAAQAQSQQQAAANANTQNVAPQANQQSQNGQSSNNAAANMAALTAAQQQQAAAEAAARNSQNNNNNGFHDNSMNDPSNVHNKPSNNLPNNMDNDDDLDDSDMSNNVPHRHNNDHNYDPTSTKSLPSPSPTDGAAGHSPQSWHTATAVLSVFFALAVIGGLVAAWLWRKKKHQKKGLSNREKMQDSFQNGMSSTKKRASNLYASFLGTAAGTSAGALGAVRNSLRDPLPYFNRPTRHNSRIGFSDPIHEVSSSGSSSHSRHYDTSRSESISDEKRHVNYSTPTLVVSPTEQQQQHPANKAREQDTTPTVRHVPSGRPELQRSNSLEARIGMATSPESEMDQAERAAENNPPVNNSSANLTAPRTGQNLLAITSMVPSTTSIYRVEIGFTAKKVGQMDLREGQTVTIRQSFDDGWVLCSVAESGREGLAPRACLSAWPVRSNTGAQNPDRVRSPEPVSSPGTPRFYSHFFSTRSVS